jgi:pSer/pThr/pTyr-binding forkhead associated (FHA) protein
MTLRASMERTSMLGELTPCGGGDPIPLLKTHLVVGRRSRCDISLRFPNVSSHHCELELVNGYWIIRDLGSRNGIKVNGTRHHSKWLMPGDVISVAKHRFEIDYTPSGDGPPPEEENPFAVGLLEKAGLASRKKDEQRPAKNPPATRGKWDIDDQDTDEVTGWLNEQDPS